MLVFLSDGFFGGAHPASKPCMLELLTAIKMQKPMLAVLEVEDKHNGERLTREALYEQLHTLDQPMFEGGIFYESQYHAWGILPQVAKTLKCVHGYSHIGAWQQTCRFRHTACIHGHDLAIIHAPQYHTHEHDLACRLVCAPT